MKLQTGTSSIRQNVTMLMQPPRSQARKKAIITLAKRHNISRKDSQFKQSIAIAKSLARKK